MSALQRLQDGELAAAYMKSVRLELSGQFLFQLEAELQKRRIIFFQ